MCVWTHILIFHQKLKFANNVTYDLIAFNRRYRLYVLRYVVAMRWVAVPNPIHFDSPDLFQLPCRIFEALKCQQYSMSLGLTYYLFVVLFFFMFLMFSGDPLQLRNNSKVRPWTSRATGWSAASFFCVKCCNFMPTFAKKFSFPN